MFRQRSLVWPFLLLPFLWLAASADRYVWLDSPNPTNDHFSSWDTAATNIMQAINAATNGETIWVTNGVYVLTNQIEVTTSITLRSVNGPNFTLLDGKFEPPPSFPEEGEEEEEEFSYRCLLVSHAEAVVEGFTLTNGYAGEDERGGGLLLANGLVRNCLITGNAAAAGAGVYIANGMLLDSIISGNTVSNFTNAVGGGIYQAGGVVANCSIIGNENMDTSSDFDAHNYRGLGGGLMLTNGVARNCLIALNKSRGNGVGVYISGGQLIDCVIQDNRDISQGAFGGGIYQDGGVVTNCIISGNQTLYGGGLYSYSGQFYNGLITKNWAARGGGVYVESTNVTAIYSSTIVSNSASTGGGIYMGAPNGVVWNSIIYHNIATRVADEHSRDLYGWSNSYNYCCADYQDFNPELNNITDDPRLVDWQEGDYRLAYNSPCINTGTNQAWMEAAQDLEGNARRIGPRVDRGAYGYVFLRAEPAAFTLSVMSNQVTNATFNLTNAGADTLYWSIIVTNDWIDLAPTNGELAAWESLEIGFTNDAQDLPAAEYFSRLLISATNTSEQQYDNTLTMTFNVMEFAADIDSLEQNVVQGLDGAPQTYHLWNAGGGELAYTITTDAPWLSVSPVGGVLTGQTAAATEVTVSFHTSSLKVGTYSGQIIISSAVADEALVLAVTCSVHADAGAQLGVSPGALALTVFQGQPMDERRLTIWNVTNAAGLSLDYEVTADQDWVSVYGGAQGPLASGEEHELLIHFDTSAFQMGVSNATITVTATSSGEPVMGAPVHIPVSINIRNMQMMVSPTKLEHTVLQWHNAATQHFELWNSYGSNAISYSISDDVSWLMVTPASGINTGQHDILTVSYSTMALDVGISNATIQVVSEDLSGAWHSTNLITVQLQILPRAALGCDAVDLLVTNRQGQISVAHNFKVWNDGLWPRGGLKWNAQADVPWLRLNPDMGRSAGEPQTINLAINASGLSPGRYRGSIVISAEDERDHQPAIRSPQIIYVEQVVTGTQSLDFFGDGISA
ncbi:MAG: hypothetical protein GX806_05610, partial [Lentisphaerae bacterium]|nr:hypothetical protein [Lentisphaerota bacterium]